MAGRGDIELLPHVEEQGTDSLMLGMASSYVGEFRKVEPPTPPSTAGILAVMFHKHVHLARKRCRLTTALVPAALYGGIAVLVGGTMDPNNPLGTFSPAVFLVPFLLGIGVSGVFLGAIVEIVTEKEFKMKAIQEIYGLSSLLYWVSWGIYYFFVSLACIVVIMSMVKLIGGGVMVHTDPALLAIILVLAYCQQFAFAAIGSVFFDRTRTASALLGILSPVINVGAVFGAGYIQGQPKHIAYLVGMLPGVNMMLSLQSASMYDSLLLCHGDTCHRGLSFHTLWSTQFCFDAVELDACTRQVAFTLSAAECLLLMVCAILFYVLLAWWLDSVWPSEFGASRPCSFCCRSSFWCPQRMIRRQPTMSAEEGAGKQNAVVMSMNDLRKEFGDKKALDGITMDVYAGEIFALLGHNGAGKTTAINCIIGMIAPTSGSADVNGFDIVDDASSVRRQLTICPQDNPLYDVFTVRQHLVFFGSLRGVKQQEMRKKTREVLTALGMPEKLEDLCTSLSGGQKRRLWVATALLGQTPITFLDEPTSGMDPASRRELWGLLLKMRGSGVSIIFTTHYLEEADALAERKAVLARGKVQAIGTSLELKRTMGLGYHLCLEMAPQATAEHSMQITELVRKHVSSAFPEPIPEEEQIQAAGAGKLERFMLPYAEVDSFGALFAGLDARLQALQVAHYTVAMTSLEEVFMALGRQAEQGTGGGGHNADFREVHRDEEGGNERNEVSNFTKMMAMVRVRFVQVNSNFSTIWATVILPILMVVYMLIYVTPEENFMISLFLPMAFGISAISYTMLLINDRQMKCKYVILSQGMPVREYWLGSLIAHYAVGLPVTILVIIVVYTVVPELWANPEALMLVAAQGMTYPLVILLYAYNMSTLFETTEMAAKVIPWLNMFAGAIPVVVVQMLWSASNLWDDPSFDSLTMYAQMLHVFFSLVNPLYALPGMIVTISLSTSVPGIVTGSFFLSWCAVPLYLSAVSILLMVMLLVCRDSRTYSASPGNAKDFSDGVKDDDVLAEEARVDQLEQTGAEATQAALVHGLRHTYRTQIEGEWKENHAVRGITYGVHSGECFGLLGPNGAGKTTTFSVLTGLVRPPSAGKVMVLGKDMSDGTLMQEAFRSIGVCPQEDPLFESITGRQHLTFYGRFKGIPADRLEADVDGLLFRLGFEEADANKKAGTYSGGMKRKLSLAIALIGRPPVLFLDEPSAAVDAAAKRHLWKVIKLRTSSQSVVLTTHSMEEAEALCDRIAIQVKGQLRCLGPPQHIKRKYGSGYQIEVFCKSGSEEAQKSRRERRRALVSFMREQFTHECALLERHASRFLFQLPPASGQDALTLGQIFMTIQVNKDRFEIADYTIAQPSLEQVFLRFAREQEEADHEHEVHQLPLRASRIA